MVIGILIALSINNWNDNNKLAEKERSLLIEMKSNLELDLEGLILDINKNEHLLSANHIVLNSLKSRVYNDSLQKYYAKIKENTVFVKNTSAYENLQLIGINIIKNDTLRIKITELYSVQYDYIRYFEQIRDEKFQYEQIIPQITKHIIRDSESLSHPINFAELSVNNEFKSVIKLNCELRNYIIETYKRIEEMISELIETIELELNK